MSNFESSLLVFVAGSITSAVLFGLAMASIVSGNAFIAAFFGAMAFLFLNLNMFGLVMMLYSRVEAGTITEDEDVAERPEVPNAT